MPIVGVHRRIDPGTIPFDLGWQGAAGESKVWRIAIRSPQATAIRLHFTEFSVGDGRVWVYGSQDKADPASGSYSGQGIFSDGDFWAHTVPGDTAIVEYAPSLDFDPASVPFVISEISHVWRSPAETGPSYAAANKVTGEPGPIAQAAPCHFDATCFPAWNDSSAAVAKITYEKNGSSWVCSGSLIITRSRSLAPYFLTANHCVDSDAVARTVEAIWNYQTSACNGASPIEFLRPRSVGARFLVGRGFNAGDFSLLLLSELPSGPSWFAGWNPNDPPIGSDLVGIHHPDGSHKRISFGKRVADGSTWVEDSFAPASQFYKVRWISGRTQGGSSGSPLFSNPGVIVGVDSYGPKPPPLGTVCDVEPFDAGYGRFSVMYPVLRPYLEDADVAVSPTTLRFTVSNGAASPSPQFINITTAALANVGFTATTNVPWIRLSSVSGSASATLPASLAVSLNSSVPTTAGNYTGTVTITPTGGTPRTVTVQATVTVVSSTVRATISPNPVPEQTPDAEGYSWFYSLKLEQIAGISTRLTSVSFNGIDLSANIIPWFGTDLIPASGSISANLRSRGYIAPSTHSFEIRGIDPGTGRSWATSATLALAPKATGPVISSGGIVNAASFRPLIAPGGIFTIFGENLARSTMQATTIPLPTVLGETTVTINGTRCPLFYVSPRQINAQVPIEVQPGVASLTVRVLAEQHSMTVNIPNAGPGVFTIDGTQAVVINQDGTLNSLTNPAKAGSVIVAYANGQGSVSPVVPSGAAAGSNPLSRAVLPVEVSIADASATVLFAGLSPGLVGLLQLNVQIPETSAAGEASLAVTIGGWTSNRATIWVGK